MPRPPYSHQLQLIPTIMLTSYTPGFIALGMRRSVGGCSRVVVAGIGLCSWRHERYAHRACRNPPTTANVKLDLWFCWRGPGFVVSRSYGIVHGGRNAGILKMLGGMVVGRSGEAGTTGVGILIVRILP